MGRIQVNGGTLLLLSALPVLAQVPSVSVSSLDFSDQDLDAAQLGGPVTWQPPGDVSTVTHYDVYVAADISGTSRSAVSLGVAVGTNQAQVVENTALGSYTHLLVYTANANGEQAAPTSVAVADSDATISSLAFQDLDLDNLDIGGDVTWTSPADTSQVAEYVVYLSTSSGSRSQVGTATGDATNFTIPTETMRYPYTQIRVYSKSFSGLEQTTPAFVTLQDSVAIITSISFTDKDLDLFELGGYMTWTVSGTTSLVTSYQIYIDMVSFGTYRTHLGSVPSGTNAFLLAPEYNPGPNSFLLVYTQSSLVEQTGNAAIGIFDVEANADSVAFTDLDLDPSEVGGTVTWNEPFDPSQVAFYDVYLALSSMGENKSQLESPVPVLTAQRSVSADTPQGGASWVLVYTRSSLVEQTTPASQALVDNWALVPSVAFTDFDIDEGDLGGLLSWTVPADVTLVTHYVAYLADEVNRSQVAEVAVGTLEAPLPVDTSKGSFVELRVYVKSTLAEQSTGQAYAFSDTAALMDYLNFTDQDLDSFEFGGWAQWPEPTDVAFVEHYAVYLAEAGNGTGRIPISGELPPENRSFLIPPDQSLPYLLVYAKSVLGEQSTPQALEISDSVVTFSSVAFEDEDLDAEELGGAIVLEPAGNLELVDEYKVFLALDLLGAGRSHITAVATEASLAQDTALGGFQYVLAYAQSSLSEQTVPVSLAISDVSAQASDLTFDDQDLDAGELGGFLRWAGPNISQVAQYVVYLASNATGSLTSHRLLSAVQAQTEELLVPDSTGSAGLTHLLVFARSTLAEQTTPAGLEFYDASATVGSLGFVDLDLDATQLGGNVTWREQGDTAAVAQYVVYLAENGNASRQLVDSVSPGAATAEMLPETALRNFSHLEVYSRSSLFEQSTPAALEIQDTNASASALEFVDQDLDALEVGGNLSWLPPVDASQLAGYSVYLAGTHLAEEPPGSEVRLLPLDTVNVSVAEVYTRSLLVEQTTPATTNLRDEAASSSGVRLVDDDLESQEIGGLITWTSEPLVPVLGFKVFLSPPSTFVAEVVASSGSEYQATLALDTALGSFTNVEVFAFSALGTQSLPASGALSDVSAQVQSLTFLDQDLDELELGGRVLWQEPADVSRVQAYDLALSNNFDVEVVASVNTTEALVAENTALRNFSQLLVYCVSVFGPQTVPSAFPLNDSAASASNVSLVDLDLDFLELGGTITWRAPDAVEFVESYVLYLASDLAGSNRTLLHLVPMGINQLFLGADTSRLPSQTYLLVYTKSALFEQSTASELQVEDSDISANNVSFVDVDLDDTEVGGVIRWTEPEDPDALAAGYVVYLADSSNRSEISSAAAGTSESPFFQNVALQGFTEAAVYTRSVLAEQTTPSVAALSDAFARVEVTFVDLDLDENHLGGYVQWTEPLSEVASYNIYLGADAFGLNRSLLGQEPADRNSTLVPADTSRGAFSHVLVFAVSSVEQTTPGSASIQDVWASASSVGFSDLDLDASEIGGEVAWQLEATNPGAVWRTAVYLAGDSGRSLVGEVDAGQTRLNLPVDTQLGDFRLLAVYTRSLLAEQSSPFTAEVNDTNFSVAGLVFLDQDLDLGELGGEVSWTAESLAQLQDYVIYLSENASGYGRSLVGATDGASQALAENTSLSAFAFVAVYGRSALAEQSTPTAQALSDAGLALVANFTDQDLDAFELGGNVTWELSVGDLAQVQSFVVYLETGESESRSQLGAVDATDTVYPMPPEVPMGNFAELTVYARSSLFEQTTPTGLLLEDTNASVSSTGFADLDLDAKEVGGQVTWNLPEDLAQVTGLEVYLLGAERSQVASLKALTSADILPDTATQDFTQVAVFTRSALTEQTTPGTAAALWDAWALAEDVTFVDQDLDALELGGNVSWVPNRTVNAAVSGYQVYLSNSSTGFGPGEHVTTEGPEADIATVPADIPLSTLRYVQVYTFSSLAEQSTPTAAELSDVWSSASNVAFTDLDLDAAELGGEVAWQLEGTGAVWRTAVYLAAPGAKGIGSRSPVGEVDAGIFNLSLPVDTPLGTFSFLAVYTRSRFAEQSFPSALWVNDTNASVENLVFVDKDLDESELGGVVLWNESDGTQVEDYRVYLSVNASGDERQAIGDVSAEPFQAPLAADTAPGIFRFITVFARSSLAEQTTPVAQATSDAFVGLLANFTDQDLDEDELGGTLQWQVVAGDTSQVQGFEAYLSESAFLGSADGSGAQTLAVPPEVPQGNSSHILLYAVSSSFRQTFPAEVLVLDTNASVSGTSFLDEDLDVGQVGGQVFWDLPEETAQVTGYLVYLSSSANRSIISQLPTTTTAVDLLPDTDIQQFSQVVVYTRSALVEQTTPDAVQLSDVQVTVENLEFVDQDLDAWELGGNATWWANDSAVVGYKVYLSNSSSGLARQPVGNLLVQRYLEVPEDTPLGDLRFLLVYTVSGLTEQTTPAALVFNDTESSVQQLEFLDKDLDVDQLGGAVTWRLPEEYAEVALYAVYLGTSAAGAGRSLVGSTVATQLDVPLDTPLQAFSHVLVYSTSVYEQSTPVALAFNDSSLQVQDLSFTDQDLDDYHLGGPVSWAPPIDTDVLEGYVVYLAGSSLGDERQLLGNVTVGSNEFLVPADTALANHSHLLVYTRSDFGEASVPAAVPILDVVSRVSDIIFVDKDLDEQELGGNVTWTPPPDLTQVAGYVLYLADGLRRSQVASPELVGANESFVEEDTNLSSLTQLEVYSRSVLAEQTTPGTLLISDAAATVTGLNFTDRDLDASELGGEVVWQIPEEPQLARYMVYLVTAGNRIPLSAALAAETSSLLVGPDLAAGVELAVYTKSSLFEQTTPATVEVVDLEATVSDVVFEDLDLDESHLGGVLNFSAPADTAEVTAYSVFFADADSSAIEVRRRVPVTPDLAPEELGALIPADIEKGNFSHVLVYTKSALVEQSTPAFGVLNDTEASVENVAFEDEDLDEGDLGGTVYWTPRGDVTAIQDYLLYVDGKLMGSAPFGMNQLNISADFRPVVQELAIYTRSRIYESSTPQVHNFSDTAASVSGIRFDDEDLDKFELTGSITWSPPPDEQVTFFRVYFASSSSGVGGSGRLQLSEQPAAVTVAYIPNNFQTVGYSHILVYTGSVLAEQTTPEALEFVDDALEVANLSFPDQDLDAQEVGGYVSWDTPNFTATVSHYAVYLSVDVFGTNRSKVGDDIPLGTNTALVPAETPLADWKYVAVYMKSPGAEQTTPASLLISDSALQAADVHLLDLDLDPQEMGGTVSWSAPFDELVTGYDVYLSPSASGLGRSLVGNCSADSLEVQLLVETSVLNFSYVLIYARSALAEQSTPAAAGLNDTQVPIEVNFTDQDLDENDLGGLVTWTVAGDWELASGYTLYLAAKADGTARSQVDISPATGRSSIFPANIPKVANGRILSNALVYAYSALAEQSTPGWAPVSDTQSMAVNISFVDQDLDGDELGGTITWTPNGDVEHVTAHLAYLAVDAYGDNRSLVGSGDAAVALAPEQALWEFSHVLVYTRSVLAEQSTPQAAALNDTISSVSNVSFPDQDLDALQLGGRVSWLPPAEMSQVTHYGIYLAGGAGRSQIGAEPAGAEYSDLQPEQELGDFTDVLVYTSSALVEQTTPQALNLSDTSSSVSGVRFVDVDLDATEIGGDVFWDPPNESSQVSGYLLYLAGPSVNRSAVGAATLGTNTLPVPEETLLPPYDSLLVYTSSALVEQTTPTRLVISDTSATVTEVLLVDKDLDLDQLGGEVTWLEPSDTAQVSSYAIFLEGPTVNRSQIGLVAVGLSNSSLPPDTALGNFTQVAIYTRSQLVEQSVPATFSISDSLALALHLSFADEDLDAWHLAGDLSWQPPDVAAGYALAQVTHYVTYLADDPSGTNRSLLAEVPLGTHQQTLQQDTERQLFLLVYTKSALVEQTTPAALFASDSASPVVNVTFVDKDLDEGEMGGTIFWDEPADLARVTKYCVYRSAGADGVFGRSKLYNDVLVGTTPPSVPVSADMTISVFQYIAVYSKSSLYEQTTPEVVEINDTVAKVQILSFTDRDLDEGDVGGIFTWLPPLDIAQVTHYRAYLSAPPTRSGLLLETPVGASQDLLPAESFLLNATHLLVYTVSSLVEQTTPDSYLFYDMSASASQVQFVDKDTDFGQVGGVVEWLPPSDTSRVEVYVTYFAQDTSGLGKSLIGEDQVNSTVLADTQLGLNTQVLVYTRSSLVEQTTPAFAQVSDTASAVPYLHFTDQDLDVQQIGGILTWQAPEDNGTITHYTLYAAEDELGANRTQIAELPFGATDVTLPSDFDLENYTHLLIYTKTDVSEQTVPTSHLIFDETALVSEVHMADKDLDALELGGTITWSPATNVLVTGYYVYLAETAAGDGRVGVNGFVPVGTNLVHLAPDAALNFSRFAVVFCASALAEQTTPSAFVLSDSAAQVLSINFTDLDLDLGHLGGEVAWQPAPDSAQVTGYFVYLANAFENDRSLVGNTSADVYEIDLAHDQDVGSFAHVLVYASSSLAEQSTPLGFNFSDTDSSVSAVNFTDRDLDANELGGTIHWTLPEEDSLVTHYVPYLAFDEFGQNRSQVSELPAPALAAHLAPDQAAGDFAHVLVFTRSALAEQTTPQGAYIEDLNASVSFATFVDQDLDVDQLGGPIAWEAPDSLHQVAFYDVYFQGPQADALSKLGTTEVGTNLIDVPVDFFLGNLTHIQIFTRSTLVEQTTPFVFAINASDASVSNIVFHDDDLDDLELGGNLSWHAPADLAQVTHYVSYLAGNGKRFQIGLPTAEESTNLSAEQPRDNFTEVAVYTRSTLAEQTTPVTLAISDTFAEVRNVSFTDRDLDFDDLGGTLLWEEPADNVRTLWYVLYLSQDAAGNGRQQVGREAVGVNQLQLQADTTRAAFDFWTVFTESALVEQTTPVALAMSDTIASVSGVSFLDLDLDEAEIGGTFYWQPPMDQQQVVYYQLYLSLVSPATAGLHPNGTQDWLKFPNGSVSVGTTHLDLLPDHPVPADDAYILVYTESTLAEQTTPVGQALNDSLASVRNVSFTDLDLDQEELGGNVTWEAVPPEEQAELVTLHDVYLAEDEVGAGRSQFASTKGDTVPLEAETPRRSFSHLLVFTRSSLAEQSRAAFLGLSDTTRLVQNLSFVDQDLDAEDLGGNVSWRQPEDSSLVVHYTVYLATSGWGADRSQVAQVEVGSTVAPVQPDTPLNFTQVLVYAQSLLAEQTTPVALNISDTVASVSNVEFVDKDLDTAELGGNVTWTEPLIDYNFVQFYDVYLANSSYGAFRAQLGAPLGAGLAETAVPVDLAQEFHTHIVVYTRSVLVEQSTPVAAQISDTSSDVQNVTFTDEDLDAEDLGGRIYWDSPAEFSQVTGYNIYISQDAFGGGRSLIAEQTLNESRQAVLVADYTLANFRHLVLYSRSSLAEQTTPVAFELSDSESVVVGLNFTDKDLDGSELGGTITWQEAGDSQLVVAYDLYLSESASGEARARLNESLPADVFDLDVPPEFPLGSATHVTIFTRSSLVEQTTPAAINISDAAWNVQEVSFFDMDLDGADLGGRIDWIPPAEELLVTSYVAYLAANASGAASDGRLQIAEVSYTQHFADLAPEQQQDFEGGFLSHVVVFTKSSLVEQTTPTALEVNDTAASVSGIVFVDRDLDEAELGGNITWQAPLDSQLVTLYSVYLSASFNAENRSQIARDVPIGTTLAQLAPETPQRWFTYVNIYTKSPVIEQTTPASLVISDSVAVLADVQLVDEDLDANELGGNISWRVVEELDLITTFAVYFTSNTSWQGLRRRTGEDVVVAEYAQLFIPPETDPPLSSYSWASVFPSSSLAERTTPFSAPVNDTISPVWNISFTDLDLDLQDLGGRITWTEPLEASQVTHYLVYLSANSSGEARSQVANEVPIDQLFIDLVPETPQLDRSFIVVYTRSVLAESTTPSSLAISDSFAVAEVNFTDQDLDATQIGGVISWTAPLPDQHLVDHFVVYLSDSVGNNRSQLSEPFTREVSIPPELYFAPHTHVAVFGASVLAEQTTPSTVEIYDADASVTNIVFQDKDLDELEMGGDILWTAPADSEQVTYYGVFLRGDTTLQIPGPVGGLVPLGTEREFLAADTAIAGFQEVAIFTRSSLVEQSTAVALSIEDEIASVSTVTFQDADQDIDMLGGRIQWQLPNDTSEVDFYVGYFAASPGANDPNDASARRFEFEIVPADFYDLPFQTPQSGFGYFLVYTKSSLAEQTTPTSLEMVDFCQNVPTLENMSLYIEQGTIVLAHYDVPEMVITKLTKVSEDGLSMEFAPLRKGPVTMIITSTTDVVGMTSTHVQNLVNAKGGASCQIDRYLTAACSNVTLQLSGCALPVGGLHNYRLWILQADETTTLPEAAYIDFVIASVLFDQGPLLYFRNQTSVGIQYIPSHQGFEWLYVLPTAGGVADQVFAGEDYLQWNQRVKSAYLGQGCQSMQVPIKGKEVKISFLHDCFFELGQGYRLFILLEDGLNRMDGTLKTMEFVYQGEMTRDSAIPYSHPVPVSTRWRVVPTTSVSSQWKLLRLRMFSDVSCERAVAVFPSPYRDPLLSTLREGAVLPNGAAFSKPGPMPANIFEAEGAWVSGQPCDANGCYIGFSFGVGGEHEAPEVSVACVELLQSEVAGEFAEGLELQYHDGQSYVGYRQASGLKGGLAKLPSFNGTVGIHVDGAKR